MRVLLFLSLALTLSACSKSSDSKGAKASDPSAKVTGIDAKAAGLEGLWLQKDEAEELRKNGTVKSICEEVNKKQDSIIMNVRDVRANGVIYIPAPQAGVELKFGVVNESHELISGPAFAEQFKDMKAFVNVKDDVLSISFGAEGSSVSMDYVKTTKEEVAQYYAFQAKCKGK